MANPLQTFAQDAFKVIDPAVLLASAFDTIEFRSRLSPNVVVNTRELSSRAPSSGWAQLVQPAVILTGSAGRHVIAPYGEPAASTGWLVTVGWVLGLVGVGYLWGKGSR